MDNNEYESKFVEGIEYISHVDIKEEVIVLDNTNDSESTLSDNEKSSDAKLEECTICCKYRSMFIILKNHDCEVVEGHGKCSSCIEISQWVNCYRNHKESHESKKEFDQSSGSTASDREENDEKCIVCSKYEFMVPLLKSHVCQVVDKKCRDCIEVLHWTICYESHIESHQTKDIVTKVKEENLGDSTTSDYEEIQKFMSHVKTDGNEECLVCLKYEVMLIILKENHTCEVGKMREKCEKCYEIENWYNCFKSHKNSHPNIEKYTLRLSEGKKESSNNWVRHLGRKFDCGMCLKLNSIVTKLVKNHSCSNSKSCLVCQEVSYWLSRLKYHKESDLSDASDEEELENLKSWRHFGNCAKCSKIPFAIVNLSKHVCRRQKGRQKCEVCREISFWSRACKRHESYHPKEVLSNFLSCYTCGKTFSTKKMLKVHKFYCKNSYFNQDMFRKRFFNVFPISKHRIFHNAPINFQYKCEICQKIFSNSSDLQEHEGFHEN